METNYFDKETGVAVYTSQHLHNRLSSHSCIITKSAVTFFGENSNCTVSFVIFSHKKTTFFRWRTAKSDLNVFYSLNSLKTLHWRRVVHWKFEFIFHGFGLKKNKHKLHIFFVRYIVIIDIEHRSKPTLFSPALQLFIDSSIPSLETQKWRTDLYAPLRTSERQIEAG